MKKRWILAALALILIISTVLIGCEKESNVPSPTTTAATTENVTEVTTTPAEAPDAPDETDKSVQIATPYEASDLSKITLCDITKGVSVDVSLNTKIIDLLSTVTYHDTKESRNESATAKYTLSFGECVLTVYSDSSISFSGTSVNVDTRIVASDDAFNYLDGVLTGEALGFDGYNAEQSIEIYKATGAKAKLEDKAAFIANLNQIKYYKTADKSHYNVGSYTYKITINGEDIYVYDNMLTVGDNLYLITAGNFDFLKLLPFESSSGTLPWV